MSEKFSPFSPVLILPNEKTKLEYKTEFQQTAHEYFAQINQKEKMKLMQNFATGFWILDTIIPKSTGLQELDDLLFCRYQSLPPNFHLTSRPEPRNYEATKILLGNPEENNPTLEQFLKENPEANYASIVNDSPSEIINSNSTKFPVWSQEIHETFSKVNFAKICQQIHSNNSQDLQLFYELCSSLSMTDLEARIMLEYLRKITPKSDFITNFESEEDSFKNLISKSVEIAKKSPIEAVFIKNDMAAGFGVVKFALKELVLIQTSYNPLQTYKNILAERIMEKSDNFKDEKNLKDHINNVFCNWSQLAIQEAIDIEKEMSFQFVKGQIVATTDNLVDPEKHQHTGNQVRPFEPVDPKMEKTVKFLNLMIMCQGDSSQENVKNTIRNITSFPYFGMDLILNKQGQIQVLEYNMRPTGVTPSFLRLILAYLQTGYLPQEYLTGNVVFANCEEKDLLVLAKNLRQKLEIFGIDKNVDIYSILMLLVESPNPMAQFIVNRLPGESQIDFQTRSSAIYKTIIQDFEPKNSITVFSKNHPSELEFAIR